MQPRTLALPALALLAAVFAPSAACAQRIICGDCLRRTYVYSRYDDIGERVERARERAMEAADRARDRAERRVELRADAQDRARERAFRALEIRDRVRIERFDRFDRDRFDRVNERIRDRIDRDRYRYIGPFRFRW